MHGPGALTDHLDKTLFVGQMKHNKKEHGILKYMNSGDEYHGHFD